MKVILNKINMLVSLFLVLLLSIFSSTINAKEVEKKGLRAAGCKTEYFLLHDLSRGFKSNKNIDLETSGTGNMVALKLLADGETDFAFTCKHHIPLVKKAKITPEDSESWATISIAKDPIVVLVHRSNPVVNLTMSQLRGIFSGSITNWKEVGGESMPIRVSRFNDEVGSGVLTVFKEIVMGKKKDGTLIDLLSSAKQFPGPTNIGAHLSQNPGAIAFMGFNSYNRRYGSRLNINGFSSTRENIIKGTYPLVANYYIIYDKKNRDKKELKAFFDYIQSDEGIQIANQSFVSDISIP
jgi:phosphate transport system substrate-binding protein